MPNQCGVACVPESNAALCARLGKTCGAVTATDNCGQTRTVSSCGTCSAPDTCSTANQCVRPCVPESDAALCTRYGKTCGRFTAFDNCGAARTVSSCGACAAPDTCGGGGTANVCGRLLPRCPTAYAQADCLTYVSGTSVSLSGRSWLCSNGNCANCAAFASCAPGASGCPWGVVWTDQGACR